jgi:hypothetical protein
MKKQSVAIEKTIEKLEEEDEVINVTDEIKEGFGK